MLQLWYVFKDGRQYGPFTWEQILTQASSGLLRPWDALFMQGMTNWVRADSIHSLVFRTNYSPEHSNTAQGRPPYQQGYQNAQNYNPGYRPAGLQAPGQQYFMQSRSNTKRSGKPLLILSVVLFILLLVGSSVYFLTRDSGKEVVSNLGTFTVSGHGGSFKGDGIEISSVGDTQDIPLNISVTKVDRKSPPSKDIAYQSELYRLEGRLDSLGGKISIRMPIPKEALKMPYGSEKELAESLFIVVEEDSYTHSQAGSPMQYRIPTKVDLSSNTLSAEIELPSDIALTDRLVRYAASGNMYYSMAAPETGKADSTLAFQIKRYSYSLKEATVKGGNFRAIFPSDVGDDNVKELLSELERQKELMEQIGFNFSGCSFPVDIYIQDMDGAIGLYQGSKWSSSQYLYLKKYPYFTESMALVKKSGNWDEMVITIGHELLHLAESLYDNTGNFKKNHPWFDKPTLWMDEAVSTWYEPIATGNQSYLPDNAKNNMDFIRTSLYSLGLDNSKKASHGYGASFYITYLTKSLNDNTLPSKIYDNIKSQKTAINPGHAMNMAIMENYNQFPEELWVSFLETYLTRPADIIKGLDTTPLWNKEVYIKASFKDNNYTLSYTGNDSMKSYIQSIKDGDSTNSSVLTLHFSMDSMSGDAFKLKVSDDGDSKKFFESPGNIKVKVTNSGKGGVMVYTVPRELRGVHTVAGAPWNFLSSSGDSRRQGGSETIVAGFSHADGKGAWKEILFIPFCNEDVSQNSKADVIIEISYEPADISGTWVGESTIDKVHFSGEITVEGVTMNSADFVSRQMPIGFIITKNNNEYSADMKELLGYDISTNNSEFTGNTIKINATRDVENAFINLDGRLSEDKSTIEGTIEIGHKSYGVLFSGTFRVIRQEEQQGP